MSNSYPSRRELRQQRESDERSKLRDEEAERWAEEMEKRQQRTEEAERQATETLAKATPVPANHLTDSADDIAPLEPADPEDFATAGRRAAAGPVDAPGDVEEPAEEPLAALGRRRADSQVTATGMLPIITKHREAHEPSKPRSRREARELAAAREQAEHDDDLQDLTAQPAAAETEPRVVRRATAPQAPPPPIPAVTQDQVADELDVSPADTIEFSTSDQYGASAMEITDIRGLSTMEIRRAELRDETEQLTQEIIALGRSNPNVIDPLLLRRQKELAEKSQELQDLETAAISIVEDADQQYATPDPVEASDDADEVFEELGDDDTGVEPDPVVETEPTAPAGADEHDPGTRQRRRARRASSAPMITGPFEVDQDEGSADAKPDFASHLQLDTEAYEPPPPKTGPDQPLEASSAHGLDTLDPKESEAPERQILTISVIVFAIGILALIVAIILLTR